MMSEKNIGTVEHFYGGISVASLDISDELHLGDRIHIHGRTTDFFETIDSMEINHRPVTEAHPGDLVAIKVPGRVRMHDEVALLTL